MLSGCDRYIADYVYALPTIAFFMSMIGVFTLGRCITGSMGLTKSVRTPTPWIKLLALSRYLSYRGFRSEKLNWNTAPIGVLLLGLVGTTYFFCW